MPQRKKNVTHRMRNLAWAQREQPVATQESKSDAVDDNPVADSEPLSKDEIRLVASSSKHTLDDPIPTVYTQTQLRRESSGNLPGGLDSLTLEDNIVLEDPPDNEEDPVDHRNPTSLGDPKGNEALVLPPPNAEESLDDKDSNKTTNFPNRRKISQEDAKKMVNLLDGIIKLSLHGHGRTHVSSLGKVVRTCVEFMAGTLNLIVETGMGLIGASETAAIVFRQGKWAARVVRLWIRAFQEDNTLPTNVYGTWNGSVMEDKDLSATILLWLRDPERARGKYIQARNVIDFFGTAAAAQFSHLIDAPPSLRTAQRWMHRMGFTWMKEKQGQFADGHERDDVQHYRNDYYIPEWIKLERQMRSWDSEGNKIPPKLIEGERPVVVWFHNESTFYAHNWRVTQWVHESKTAGIYKKGEGVLLMVADFVSADYGWLQLAPEHPDATPIASAESTKGENTNNARVIFRAGNQRDGWFGTSDVVKQLSRAMSIIKRQYPNEDHVFVFDNATIHTKLPENTPNVSKMTLGPSQKVMGEEIGSSGEKIKVKYAPAILPDGTVQQLYHPLDHPNKLLQGAFKGMALILEERGIPNAQKLKLVCPATGLKKQGCPLGSTNCCARRTMMNQPDIVAQKSIIQLQAEANGFLVMYLPKYHCELNPIEQCWGAAKRVYRDTPTSSTEADLKQNMLRSLELVKLESIRRFAARSQRFIHAYCCSLSGSQAAWAMKQFRGHRIIPDALLEAMDKEDSSPLLT